MLGLDGDNDPKGRGARVTGVFPRLPAKRGFKDWRRRDEVCRTTNREYGQAQGARPHPSPGATVEISVLRDDKPVELRATLVARPIE